MSTGKRQLIAGLHSVRTALKHGSGAVGTVWIEARRKDRRIQEIVELARQRGVDMSVLAARAGLESLGVDVGPFDDLRGLATRNPQQQAAFPAALAAPPPLVQLAGSNASTFHCTPHPHQ